MKNFSEKYNEYCLNPDFQNIASIIIFSSSFLYFLIYGLLGKYGSKNETAQKVYKIFTKPYWKHFKEWLAFVATDPLGDTVITLIMVLLPIPFIPCDFQNKFETFLAKLGIFRITLWVVLGKPVYNADQTRSTTSVVVSLLIMILVIFGVSYSFLKKKINK